jgi:hypothetical protein
MPAEKSGKPLSVRTPSETPGQKPKKELPEALRRNLWKPGQSGNPGGRPKKLTGPLEEFLSRRVPHDMQKRQYVDLLIESMVKRAIAKSDPLIKEIFERVEGHVPNDPAAAAQFGNRIIVVDIPRPPKMIDVGSNGHKPPEDEE